MSATTGIQWTDHTFNPWWGCTKVSAGCTNCYAERDAKRYGHDIWGPGKDRRLFGEKHWNEPRKWNRQAEAEDVRRRVFCASMADVFEADAPARELPKLWALIEETPYLDWQLLTKRPERVLETVPPSWLKSWPRHVWLGCSVEDQATADERIPHLLATPAAVRFVSAEPLLGAVDLRPLLPHAYTEPLPGGDPCKVCGAFTNGRHHPYAVGVDWVIVGSESGPRARPMETTWAASIVAQCRAAGVACFVKQIANAKDRKGGNPEHWPPGDWPRDFPQEVAGG